MTTTPGGATGPEDDGWVSISWRVVLRASLVGLAIVVPVTLLRVLLDRELADFDDSGWIYPLFVLLLVGYFVAGWVAGRAEPTAPLTHGALAGIGVLVLWIPIRIAIWAVREDGRALFTGERAALRPGQVFGQIVISATLSMAGALVAARVARGRATTEAPAG